MIHCTQLMRLYLPGCQLQYCTGAGSEVWQDTGHSGDGQSGTCALPTAAWGSHSHGWVFSAVCVWGRMGGGVGVCVGVCG